MQDISLFVQYCVMQNFSDLPPSQGGKYSGFGYTKEAPPRSQSQEFVDTAISSLSTVRIK